MRLSYPMPVTRSRTFGPDRLAQAGHGVDEGELGGEERVRGVLDELGGGRVGDDRRRTRVAEQLGHAHGRLTVVGADDDAVGVERVRHRGALAEELGVGDDDDVGAADDALDEADGAHRHGRLVHDDRPVGEVRRDLRRGRRHAREVGRAVLGLRRLDAEEHELCALHRVGGALHGTETTRRDAPPSASRRARARRWASVPGTARRSGARRARRSSRGDRGARGSRPWGGPRSRRR